MTNPVPQRIDGATVTIAASASLSGALNLGGRAPVGIIMPASWTTAGLTFQVSLDGTTYADLYAPDAAGDQAEVTHDAAASRFVALPALPFAGARYLKVRSGTAASPVNQTAERVLTVVMREFW